ncbi:hypothetical protein BCR37DRAFT_393944 [Protomyces lactucae-debilis]|uniref:Mitochondrial adapter protein MCP1 transmembrane domain-containing protein n=1 Tax=Protomyces lactucae-debilis TaxID=2754530 RepID=A0A1Y2F8T3_PROLT|nr:uncharacterized protein BCR37DRAFT_393944 [Protomyces lactucae-debilis]ORY79864.1 hypothetical protein BCR37DRAFT_393944 [Protomyces lactucae-debilis]
MSSGTGRGEASENETLSLDYIPPSPIHTPVLTRENTINGAPTGVYVHDREERKDRYLSLLLNTLRTTHRWSAYTFTGFGLIHFLNTGVAPLLSEPGWAIRTLVAGSPLTKLFPSLAESLHTGPLFNSLKFADDNLLAARALYHAPYVEATLVFAPIAIHVGTGILLRLLRIARERYWFSDKPRKVTLSWQARAGYLLAPLLAAHVFVNRIVPKALDLDITASLVGHILAQPEGPEPLLQTRIGVAAARVAYAGFVALGAWHMTAGLAQFLQLRRHWAGLRIQIRPARVLSWTVMALWTLGLARIVMHESLLNVSGV